MAWRVGEGSNRVERAVARGESGEDEGREDIIEEREGSELVIVKD